MPIKILLADEVDAYKPIAEGDQIELGIQRTKTYSDRKVVIVSTPIDEETSNIVKWMGYTDYRKFFVPCPHCGHFQTLEFSSLVWRRKDDVPEKFSMVNGLDFDSLPVDKPYYLCSGCKRLISENEKVRMLRSGQWRGTKIGQIGYVGFHINQLYSPFANATWVDIMNAFKNSIDHNGKFKRKEYKTFITTVLGEAWKEDELSLDENALLNRCEDYGIPEDVVLLTAGVDTQDNWIEVVVTGWTKGEHSWIISREQYPGKTTEVEVWERAMQATLAPRKTDDGRTIEVKSVAIDSGGHSADMVRKIGKKYQGRGVHVIRGKGGQGLPLIVSRTDRNMQRVPVYTLGTDGIKDTIFNRVNVDSETVGYMHFKVGVCNEDFFSQLNSEYKKLVYKTGNQPYWAYVKRSQGSRNEVLDCVCYAYTAMKILNPDLEYMYKAVLDWRENGGKKQVFTKKLPNRRENFANSWR